MMLAMISRLRAIPSRITGNTLVSIMMLARVPTMRAMVGRNLPLADSIRPISAGRVSLRSVCRVPSRVSSIDTPARPLLMSRIR